jgi:nitroimidazol reductase NimA-like FMN-containing flavoprotein (pyridoxamine 5'-phosphate oxidase superfamily)
MAAPVPDRAAELLSDARLTAYLATSHANSPHVAPVWYRYDDGVVELTTTGRKLRDLTENPRVSIAVQRAEAGIPEWAVTLRGTASVIEDAEATERARRAINRKYGADPDAYPENTLVRVAVGSATVREF